MQLADTPRIALGKPGRPPGWHEMDQTEVKAALAERIIDTIRNRGLTQQEAADALGIDQPKVSRLLRRQIDEFSTPRLLRFLTMLGRDIEIVVRPQLPHRKSRGRLRVVTSGEPAR